jgi:ankyrin repeat protein
MCRTSSLMIRKLSAVRVLLLTILILFSTSFAADETDSLLFQLAVNGPVTELALCIVKCASINTRRADGVTPLLAAVQANNRATVAVLLEHGADASIADTMNLDPLYWALYKGFYPVADIL